MLGKNQSKTMKVFLSDDCDRLVYETNESAPSIPADTHLFPESGKNGKQIRSFVFHLMNCPQNIITSSLYLLREIHLQKIPVIFVNHSFKENKTYVSESLDEIGPIEPLDSDLEQSERYMNTQ